MPFVLTLVDADGNLTESTLTLNRLRAEGLPRDLKTGDAGLHGFTLTPEPTNDEKFLFDEFTKLIERFDPLAGIHSAETALAAAIEATNARIAERLSEVRGMGRCDEKNIGTCQACQTDEVAVREYGEDRGTCERRVALCDLCAVLLFGNTERHPSAGYVIEDLARDIVALFRQTLDRLERIEKKMEDEDV